MGGLYIESKCASCKKGLEKVSTPPEVDSGEYICAAYPDGVPDEILFGGKTCKEFEEITMEEIINGDV